MIVETFQQRSEDWIRAHIGIPTASAFGKILTPATGKPSTQAEVYMYELLAQWLTGQYEESYQNQWMERGIELEPKARQYYEIITDREIEEVGFIYKDEARLTGCSPDGLIDRRNGGVEIKSPKASTHLKFLLQNQVPIEYKAQIQGSLWLTELEYWDWLSYHPDMSPVIIRAYRDEPWIKKLEVAINAFIEEMLERRQDLIERGLKCETVSIA